MGALRFHDLKSAVVRGDMGRWQGGDGEGTGRGGGLEVGAGGGGGGVQKKSFSDLVLGEE